MSLAAARRCLAPAAAPSASDEHRVVVAWEDGSELDLRPGSPERERLARIAEGVLG